jgi:hypothetical protein
MLWGSIIFIAVVIIGSVLVSWLFRPLFPNVVVVILNALLLYLLLYRAYYDLRKGRWLYYLAALVIAALLVYSLPGLAPFWPITLVVILIFIMIEVARGFGVLNKKVRVSRR